MECDEVELCYELFDMYPFRKIIQVRSVLKEKLSNIHRISKWYKNIYEVDSIEDTRSTKYFVVNSLGLPNLYNLKANLRKLGDRGLYEGAQPEFM